MPSFSSTRSLMRFTVSVGSMSNSISLPARQHTNKYKHALQTSMQPRAPCFSPRPPCSRNLVASLQTCQTAPNAKTSCSLTMEGHSVIAAVASRHWLNPRPLTTQHTQLAARDLVCSSLYSHQQLGVHSQRVHRSKARNIRVSSHTAASAVHSVMSHGQHRRAPLGARRRVPGSSTGTKRWLCRAGCAWEEVYRSAS